MGWFFVCLILLDISSELNGIKKELRKERIK
jgi:hypothetical protein